MFHFRQIFDHTSQFFMPPTPHDQKAHYIHSRQIQVHTNHTKVLFQFKTPVKLTPISGEALLIIQSTLTQQFYPYLLHSEVTLKENIPFNILSLKNKATVALATQVPTEPIHVELATKYVATPLPQTYQITDISTVITNEYRENMTQQTLPSQYYELLIVEKGQITMQINQVTYQLTAGQAFFIQPEQRSLRTHQDNGETIIQQIFFAAEHFPTQSVQTVLNATTAVSPLIDALNQDLTQNNRMNHLNYLIQSLIYTLVTPTNHTQATSSTTAMQEKIDHQLLQDILAYINNDDTLSIKIADIVAHFDLSRSTVQQLFNRFLHLSPKAYLNKQRLEKSRQLIRESNLSITQIAEQLGYGSLQYFSRAFSQAYHISPSDYAKSYAKRN